MTPTKDQQAQEYAEKQRLYAAISGDGTSVLYTPKQFVNAYLDGYTACEQSMWRSVEEEMPEDMINVLVHCSDSDPDISDCIAYLKNGIWCFMDDFYIGCTVSHWMPIPSIPDTNTEKK